MRDSRLSDVGADQGAPPWSEDRRLAALDSYAVLDTPREADFDDIAAMAAAMLKAPIAVVNFIAAGRQWFKAEIGIGQRELPLDVSICKHALLEDRLMVAPDLTQDDRFRANPLVTVKDGLRFYAGAPLRTPEGLPLGTLCVLDVEARPGGLSENEAFILETLARHVMTQLELRRSEASLRDLNESLERKVEERTRERDRAWKRSRDLQLVLDQQGVFRLFNDAWTVILGWTEADLLGHSYTDFLHPDDLAPTTGALMLATVGPPPPFENRFRHKRGGYRWFSWVAAPEDGLIYASGRHITDEKQSTLELAEAQEQLRQSQKLEAVGQLTGGVAHDFNNLLTIIRSSVDFLGRPDLPEDRRRRYIGAISDTVDRAAKLTSQLLAFARRQPLKPEVFDVGEKVTGVAEMVRTLVGARVLITLSAPAGETFVEADLGQFETALVNLAVNARDAMDGEGRIAIRVERVKAIPAMRAHASRAGDFIAISVKDSGSGISPEKMDAVFEPFFTTKEVGKGTGLGLSQVFGFAKQSHGEVGLESQWGRGATFTLYLPRTGRPAEEAAVAPQELPHALGLGAYVLVVEDNEAVGQFSTEMLHDLGYKTAWASSARQALDILRDAEGGFDLIFSDVIMPGMNGVEFAKLVRERYPHLPVVLTSGYSEVLAAEGRHGFELIQKPYSVEVLSHVLRTALAGQAAAGR